MFKNYWDKSDGNLNNKNKNWQHVYILYFSSELVVYVYWE